LRAILWTEEAVSNLQAIETYISAFNPAAAHRLAMRIIDAADSLADFPNRGRKAGADRREIVSVWPYIIRYRVEADAVLILRVRHGAREEEE
jgi:toxin ParE1/3/4